MATGVRTGFTPQLGLDETMELLSRVLGAGAEDRDVSALSAALKTKLGLSDLKKPPPTVSPGLELWTRDVKSCRAIRSSPMDTYPSPFHPCVTTVPVCNVGDTTRAEMKSYGLAALAHPSPPSDGTGDPGVPSRGTKAIATRTFRSNSPSLIPKTCPSGLRSSLNFHSLQDSNMLTSGLSAHSSRSRAKRNFSSGK